MHAFNCLPTCLPAAAVAPDGSLVEEQAENSMHCPWELYTPGTTHQARAPLLIMRSFQFHAPRIV
jgi:hypothetical protein